MNTTQVQEKKISSAAPLKFSDIKEPDLFALVFYKGGGTKLFHSYLDSHPEIYNIPAFPLLYFYPHWRQWQEQYQEVWDWETIIHIFCLKHASVINSSKIPGLSGLAGLGEGQNENIAIDGEEFRRHLKNLLREEPVRRRTFLLSVFYAYALCKGEDLTTKKAMLWHHHMIPYLEDFLSDFPDAKIMGMIRDPRIKIYSMVQQDIKTDLIKLSLTDAMIYRSNVFYQQIKVLLITTLHFLRLKVPGGVYFVRHEDLASDLSRVMKRVADLTGIKFQDSMLECTFDGKLWWGHEIHAMPKVGQAASDAERAKKMSQEALKRVLSTSWQKQKPGWEIFVLEGLDYDFLKEYGYTPLYYKQDTWGERLALCAAVWVPFRMEIEDTWFYLNPANHIKLITAAWQEATGTLKRKYYGFSATYLFKHSYKAFHLWNKPWLVQKIERVPVLNVIYTYLRFWLAICLLPLLYLRRIALFYYIFFRRLFKGSFLAAQI